jgi:hypothetical protein
MKANLCDINRINVDCTFCRLNNPEEGEEKLEPISLGKWQVGIKKEAQLMIFRRRSFHRHQFFHLRPIESKIETDEAARVLKLTYDGHRNVLKDQIQFRTITCGIVSTKISNREGTVIAQKHTQI